MITYKEETYRDERLFVFNLTHGKEEEKSKWILVTYRNTIELPVYKTNCFDTKEDAIQYLKKVEQFTPLISNNEQPLEIAESAISDWDYYNNWLKENNLFSAISEKQHCPFWRNNKGWDYTKNYMNISHVKNGFHEEYIHNGKIKLEGTYNMGAKDGIFKQYHASGELHIKCTYKDDVLDGPYKRFHENGALASKGQVKENEQDGEWQYFDELGNLIETKTYSNGVLRK